VQNLEGMFIRFDRIHERDRRTDTRTPHHRPRLHSIARQKRPNGATLSARPGPAAGPGVRSSRKVSTTGADTITIP